MDGATLLLKNRDAKNARCSRRIALGFFVTFIWVEKGVFMFQTG